MKKIISFIGIVIELAVLIGLLWKHTELYDFEILFYLLLIFPILMIFHWLHLRKEYKKNRFSHAIQIKLSFLTGPSFFLCLSLLLSINYQLKSIRLAGGPPKEMGQILIKMTNDSYPDSIPQWVKYNVKKMKSDSLLYMMLMASTSLLYASRYYSKIEYGDKEKEIKDSQVF